MKIRSRFLWSTFFLVFILFSLLRHQSVATEPFELVVEKHVLLPDAHLVDVLRTTFKIPTHLIFNEYLNLIQEINPDIKDLNAINDYQTILIPLALPPESVEYRIVIMEPGRITRTLPSTPQQKKGASHTPMPAKTLPLETIDVTKIVKNKGSRF